MGRCAGTAPLVHGGHIRGVTVGSGPWRKEVLPSPASCFREEGEDAEGEEAETEEEDDEGEADEHVGDESSIN